MSCALGAARRAARRAGGVGGAAGVAAEGRTGVAGGAAAAWTADTHAALPELLRVDGRREVQSPRVVGHRVLPVHEAFGRLPDAGACGTESPTYRLRAKDNLVN